MVHSRTLHRIEARIRERAAYCLQFELNDPRSTFVTITKVQLDPEMKTGKIYWSCLGDRAEVTRTSKMLEGAAGFIQRQVARVLEMRNMPHLTWDHDDSLEKAADMTQMIADVIARDDDIRPPSEAGPAADGTGTDGPGSTDGPEEKGPA